jgi:glycosyltransferase involved in cell wall biosynthesis
VRIALISLYLPSGSKIGVGYQVHGLANALTRRGHDVTVLSPCPQADDALYRVEVVPPGKSLRTFGFAWDLRKINYDRFDVLNAHGDDWFLWGVKRPRHVHTYHGAYLAEAINIKGAKERLRMAILAVCEQQSVLLPDETVTVSENSRRYIAGIRHVIPCGVDTASFSPGSTREGRPTLLFVGTIHGRKRGRWLCEIFQKQVLASIPDAQLWCVSEPPADAGSFPPSIQFLGRVSEQVLTDLYRRAWAFCLPSTYEGFGVPYIEAMASGLPVVASANPGAVEVLDKGRYGKIAADEDLGPTLVSVLSDESLRSTMSVAGLARSREYSWASVCARYETVYRGEAQGASPEVVCDGAAPD